MPTALTTRTPPRCGAPQILRRGGGAASDPPAHELHRHIINYARLSGLVHARKSGSATDVCSRHRTHRVARSTRPRFNGWIPNQTRRVVFTRSVVAGRMAYSKGPALTEADRDEPVEKQIALYACPRGHEFDRWLAPDADPPEEWECPQHGLRSPQPGLVLGPLPASRIGPRPGNTHWDHVKARRSIPELKELLAEALAKRGMDRCDPLADVVTTTPHRSSA
ncbi:RNA polymerase-binding protein RbpA [Lentzea sp. NPDC102401]|uniref:RNA polymerase-binding protein RbpA n=1 Tax=Lentzea sp. NPDC102401 TaxID=3364128 RepID=UPI003815DF3A